VARRDSSEVVIKKQGFFPKTEKIMERPRTYLILAVLALGTSGCITEGKPLSTSEPIAKTVLPTIGDEIERRRNASIETLPKEWRETAEQALSSMVYLNFPEGVICGGAVVENLGTQFVVAAAAHCWDMAAKHDYLIVNNLDTFGTIQGDTFYKYGLGRICSENCGEYNPVNDLLVIALNLNREHLTDGLFPATTASVDSETQLKVGDEVLLTSLGGASYFEALTIHAQVGRIKAIENPEEPSKTLLITEGLRVIAQDSGGGVFIKGKDGKPKLVAIQSGYVDIGTAVLKPIRNLEELKQMALEDLKK